MADNTVLPPGVGGDTIRTLDKTGTGVPKTEVVALDLGGGDGRSEFISGFPLPAALPEVPVDDDGIPTFSMSPNSMDALEILFRQTIAAVNAPYALSSAELTAGFGTGLNQKFPVGDPRRFGADPAGLVDSATAFTNISSVGQPITIYPGTYLVNSNITIAPNIVFQPGAILRPANGVTITLGPSTSFQAGSYQIFDLTLGGLIILPGPMGMVRATWWGAQALPSSKTNNEVAFNQAWMALLLTPTGTGVANGMILIDRGDWYKSGSSYHSNNISFVGDSSINTLVIANNATWPTATAITFTGAPAANATSATLNANWGGTTDVYMVLFTETTGGLLESRQVTLTNGATTATWATGLTVACNAAASVVNNNGSNMFRSQRADPVLFTAPLVSGATSGTVLTGYAYPGATNTAPVVPTNLGIVFFQRNGAACEFHRIPSITNGATTITWIGGLTANCTFYAAILDEQAIFSNHVSHLRINGGNLSAANLPRQIYAPAWQQQSGGEDLYFENFNADGVFIDQGYGGAALIRMYDWQFAPNADANGYGIHINLPNYTVGYYQTQLHDISCSSATAAVTLANPVAQPVTFTGAPASGATSATLNTNWTGTTGSYLVFFIETAGGANEMRTVTLTNAQTTATWSTGLGANCNATTAASNNAAGITGILSATWPYFTGIWMVVFSEDGTGGGSSGFPRTRFVTLTNGATTAAWQGDLPHTITASASGVTPRFSFVSANGNVLLNCDDVHTELLMNAFSLFGNATVTGNSISVGGNPNVATLFLTNTSWSGYIKASGVTPGGVLNLIYPEANHLYAQCNFVPPEGELVWPPVPTLAIAMGYITGAATPVLTFGYNMASVTHQATSQQRLTLTTPAAHSTTTLYYPGQCVSVGGSGYLCIVSNINQVPPNATYWTVMGDGVNSYGVEVSSGDSAVPFIYYTKVNAYQFDVFTPGTDAAEFTAHVYHKT